MAKTPKTSDEAKAEDVKPEAAAVADEPKFGKVEARLAALEAYVRENAKALGWPAFKG